MRSKGPPDPNFGLWRLVMLMMLLIMTINTNDDSNSDAENNDATNNTNELGAHLRLPQAIETRSRGLRESPELPRPQGEQTSHVDPKGKKLARF